MGLKTSKRLIQLYVAADLILVVKFGAAPRVVGSRMKSERVNLRENGGGLTTFGGGAVVVGTGDAARSVEVISERSWISSIQGVFVSENEARASNKRQMVVVVKAKE